MRSVDGPLPDGFSSLLRIGVQIMTNIGVIIILTPLFLCPGLAVAALGFYLGNIYLRAQLSVRREMRWVNTIYTLAFLTRTFYSNARAPVLAHFGTAISGIGRFHSSISP